MGSHNVPDTGHSTFSSQSACKQTCRQTCRQTVECSVISTVLENENSQSNNHNHPLPCSPSVPGTVPSALCILFHLVHATTNGISTTICQILLMKKPNLARLNNIFQDYSDSKLQRYFQTLNSLVVELKFLNTRPVCLNLREAMEGSQSVGIEGIEESLRRRCHQAEY